AYQRARNCERQKYRRRDGGVSLWTGSSRSDILKSGTRTCGMVPWSGTCKEGGTPRARQLAADGQKLAEPAATMREKEREIMKGKGRRERRQASLRTIDVSAKDQRNRRSKWYAKASCRGGLIRIADWRMRGGPSIRNARMRRMIRVDLTNSAISIVGKRLETISQLSAFLNEKRLPDPGVLHVTEKNTKENKEPQSVSLDCSQAINKKTMVNKINPISKDLFTDENYSEFIALKPKEGYEEKDNVE
ncbi:hypothetical protein V1477_017900, partial [Vespula maculifrons]